ncbi:hypothetical protein CMUST_09510 [Corynebacterium mustelae]|uniref:Uncharacterized protein n=1 Tax=Corynebacterium mustelae TaxID=571915 RepID=A0A0G3H338_9CORY|nr:hypothetical protein [Corynebacterium mustelae]AKK06218.1 hypothetical protein CMUST_09510 [Corynebacterium mustelae]
MPRNWRRKALACAVVASLSFSNLHATQAPAVAQVATPHHTISLQAGSSEFNPEFFYKILGGAAPLFAAILGIVFWVTRSTPKESTETSKQSADTGLAPHTTTAPPTTESSTFWFPGTTPSPAQPSPEAAPPASNNNPVEPADAAAPNINNTAGKQTDLSSLSSSSSSTPPRKQNPATPGSESDSSVPRQIQRVLDEINSQRRSHGLNPVMLDTELSKAEQKVAEDFIRSGVFQTDHSMRVVPISGEDPVIGYRESIAKHDFLKQLVTRPDLTKVGIGLATNGFWWGGLARFVTEGDSLTTNEARVTKLIDRINQERRKNGVNPLHIAPSFTADEVAWAKHMKEVNKLYFSGTRRAVWRAHDPLEAVAVWAQQSGFNFILTDSRYSHVAVGLYQDGDEFWISARPITPGVALQERTKQIESIITAINNKRRTAGLSPLTVDDHNHTHLQKQAQLFANGKIVQQQLPLTEVYALADDPLAAAENLFAQKKNSDVLLYPRASRITVAIAEKDGFYAVAVKVPRNS